MAATVGRCLRIALLTTGLVFWLLFSLAFETAVVLLTGVVVVGSLGWGLPLTIAGPAIAGGVVIVTALVGLWDWRESRIPFYERQVGRYGVLVNQDDFGKLWRIGSNLVVEVVNTTPERDGSHRHFFVRVPPETRTAHEAVAWTFGFQSADEYAPATES